MKENFTPGERRGIILLTCVMIVAAVVIKCQSGAASHIPHTDPTVAAGDSVILLADTSAVMLSDTVLTGRKKAHRPRKVRKAQPASKSTPVPRRTRDERIN